MKKLTFAVALSIACFSLSFAQTSQTFNYQGMARNGQGLPLANTELKVRIGILQNDNLIWQEDHAASTNSLGIFTVSVGDPGATNTLGSVNSFSEIPWNDGGLIMQVYVDAGDGFEDLGTTVLQAVPYSLYAADAPDSQDLILDGTTLNITGGTGVDLEPVLGTGTGTPSQWSKDLDTLTTLKHVGIGTTSTNRSTLAVQGLTVENEIPLFEVRREDGFPVFAVYNDGVMVYVDEENKAVKRGFAVGSFSRSAKGPGQEYLRVTPDSVRVYVPDEAAKGVKGGFAVGGFRRSAKGTVRDLLFVNPDSTRVYVPNKGNDDPFYEGLQGGFAVSGYEDGAGGPQEYLMGINRGITRFNTANNDRGFAIGSQGEGWGSNFLELTPTNSFIGSDAGVNTQQIDPDDEFGWGLSTMNVFVGYQAGMENLYGHHNTFLGFCAGTKTTGNGQDPEAGAHNIFIGSQAGFENTEGSYNTYIGYLSGFHNLNGFDNVFIGSGTGQLNESGSDNVFIGTSAGATGVNTSASTMVGADAGREYQGGGDVTFIGRWAGNNNAGERNTFVGRSSGGNTGTGSDNVAMGFRAGQYNTGNRNIAIGNGTGEGTNGSSASDDNTLIGHAAGNQLRTGGSNTLIGAYAGYSNQNGSGNVFIGKRAGFNETGNNTLYISNNDTDYPLIFGFFDGSYVELNGDVAVNGVVSEASDEALKTNIRPVTGSLDKLRQLNGVSFQWKDEAIRKGTGSESHMGLVAQEVEQVFPSLVGESRNGHKTVHYSGMIPVLLEAIKEQQEMIELLEQRIADLESR